MALTPKQERFVDEYLVDLNGKQAAIRAGYSPTCAEVTASRLLRNAKVAAAVAEARQERAERTAITQDGVVQELACIAFSDVRELFDEQGNPLPPHRLPDHVRGAVASVTVGEDARSVRIQMCDKLRALALLAKHLGLFKAPTPPQAVLAWFEPAALSNLPTEDLERAVGHAEAMEAILAGCQRLGR